MSTRLGRATTATQDIYMHVVPSLEDSSAEQITDLIFCNDDEDDGELDA